MFTNSSVTGKAAYAYCAFFYTKSHIFLYHNYNIHMPEFTSSHYPVLLLGLYPTSPQTTTTDLVQLFY